LKLDLNLKDIEDPIVRENFFRLKRFIEEQTILDGFFTFFEIDIPAAVTSKPVKHNLSFIPKDIVLLSITGDYNAYFNYNDFTSSHIYITAAGPCVIRFLVGTFNKGAYRG
jgi:hypothetical protein